MNFTLNIISQSNLFPLFKKDIKKQIWQNDGKMKKASKNISSLGGGRNKGSFYKVAQVRLANL